MRPVAAVRLMRLSFTDHNMFRRNLKERFDSFVCTQTLNVISDVDGAVRGARIFLSPAARSAGTVAGISQISRYDAER